MADKLSDETLAMYRRAVDNEPHPGYWVSVAAALLDHIKAAEEEYQRNMRRAIDDAIRNGNNFQMFMTHNAAVVEDLKGRIERAVKVLKLPGRVDDALRILESQAEAKEETI